MNNRLTFVSGFARSFLSSKPIPDATITVLENSNLKFKTNSEGKFGPFEWTIGEPITLVFEKTGNLWTGYKTTQTATLIVPPEGFNNENFLKNISFQVPSNIAYKILSIAMGKTEDNQACQIAATITPPNTTLDDIPQGVADVKVTLSPSKNIKPFYFDIFPLIHKTNPFNRKLTATSEDGGVAFVNVPPGDYVLEAKKEDVTFSHVKIKARAGILVNACPAHGPTMQTTFSSHKKETKQNPYHFFRPVLAVGLGAIGLLALTACARKDDLTSFF